MCFVLTDLLKAACFELILANLGKVISVCSVVASPYLITVLTYYSTTAVKLETCDKAD